jgi:hypothetical protein
MTEASDYLENALVDHITGKTSYTKPTAYVALCTAAPNDASTGTTMTEAAYTSYARVSTAGSDWNASSAGSATNANAITFPACTGGSESITHFVLVDAATAGNILVYSALDASLAVSTGITPTFAADAITVTVS